MNTRKKVMFFVVGFIVVALIAVGGVYFLWLPNLAENTSDPVVAAVQRLEEETEIKPEFYVQNEFVRFVHAQVPVEGVNSVERARNFLDDYRVLYQQDDPNLALHVRRVSGDNDEFVTFYQTYRGIEVFGGEILVVLNGEKLNATIGGLLPSGVILDTYPLVDAGQAISIAKETVNRPDSMVMGEATIMVYDLGLLENVPSDPHLAWRIPLGPGSTDLVYVDAHNGEVLTQSNLTIAGYELDHEDANWYPDGNVDCYWNTTDDDWIGDETGLISEYLNDTEAVYSWWHSKNAYYYFSNQHGWDSYDNGGGELELYIYSGAPNARWVGGTGCDLIEFRQGWVSWDVMIHEYTHGIQFDTSQIGMHGGYGEAFSLKESFADIQGLQADPDDWTLGEDRTGISGIVRSASNPPINHYDNYIQNPSKGDGYDNSGIPTHAAYLTATGAIGVYGGGTGLGRSSMANIYYSVMRNLPHSAQFIDARNLAMVVANQWYNDPLKECMVKNAWAAVGVGIGDLYCDGIPDPDFSDTDGDHLADVYDNCPNDPNFLQKDFDHDGIGDVCDPDDDNDYVPDTQDNCPHIKNSLQSDVDGDGIGDLCDDDDGDSVLDIHDNCPKDPNPNQVDSDGDGLGNACDDDLDGDGVNEYVGREGQNLDNCPFEPNPDQLDSDGDGIGDACDGCPNDFDYNQAYTAVDPFLADLGVLPQPYQPDSDGDGIPDACDDDIRLEGRPIMAKENMIDPDDLPHALEVIGSPGGFIQISISRCHPEEGDWYPQNTRGRIVFENVDDKVGVWLGDSAGFGAAKTKTIENQRIIEFTPRGGMNYFLLVGFHPDYSPDEAKPFSIKFDCYLKEIQPETKSDYEPLSEIPGPPPVLEGSPTPTIAEEPPPEEVTATEEPASRCDLFDGEYSLSMLDIPYGSTALTLFIQIPDGVPGLEIGIPGDDQPWEYSAKLGDVAADRCSYQGYAGRLYCDFDIPETYFDTAQMLAIYVNGCDEPIYQHPRVSIFAPEEPAPVCSADLAEEDCVAAGGTYECRLTCVCSCP